MSRCQHPEFAAQINVIRLTGEDGETLTGFLAEVRIECAACGRNMQFRGLPAGIHTGGACVSVDGLEARLGLVPQGEEQSFLDTIGAVFVPDKTETH